MGTQAGSTKSDWLVLWCGFSILESCTQPNTPLNEFSLNDDSYVNQLTYYYYCIRFVWVWFTLSDFRRYSYISLWFMAYVIIKPLRDFNTKNYPACFIAIQIRFIKQILRSYHVNWMKIDLSFPTNEIHITAQKEQYYIAINNNVI